MVYGTGEQMLPELQSWRQHGYIADMMTAASWGDYQDYFDGRFDGKTHMDEAQTDANGDVILHWGSKTIPSVSPGESFSRYLAQRVRHAVDGGVQSIYIEEPEFWARSGWEENFKREWKAYYGEDWQPPNSSPDAQYRASKLKYFLYRRELGQVFDSTREYGRLNGRTVHCYVATHSLINYADWLVVSPESSLLAVSPDGFIAQVWTGSARAPNYYNGVLKERTFETAFLEYGSMQNLARASGLTIRYLNDPVEDDPDRDWNDYRSSFESTVTASLLYPEVWRYEIMTPERIFNSKHPAKHGVTNNQTTQLVETADGFVHEHGSVSNIEEIGIPKAYETEIQSVMSALKDMKQKDVRWEETGTGKVGVLVSDTMMFERADPFPSDASLGSFYGLALPLLAHGLPVEPVQIEYANSPGFLNRYKMLLLTYEGQKPPTPEFHDALAEWVRNGGALVVIDNDDDRYNGVREWWNRAPDSYKTPREHLFLKLGISKDAVGLHAVGRGVILSERISPAALTYRKDGGETVRGFARQAAAAVKLPWKETNALVLRRGPYIIAAGLNESIPGARPYVLHGRFVNLFDANLSILTRAALPPGTRMLLMDVNMLKGNDIPHVIVASCRISDEHAGKDSLTFKADGISDTNAVARINTARKPTRVIVGGAALQERDYELSGGTLLIHFQNAASPLQIEIDFPQ